MELIIIATLVILALEFDYWGAENKQSDIIIKNKVPLINFLKK